MTPPQSSNPATTPMHNLLRSKHQKRRPLRVRNSAVLDLDTRAIVYSLKILQQQIQAVGQELDASSIRLVALEESLARHRNLSERSKPANINQADGGISSTVQKSAAGDPKPVSVFNNGIQAGKAKSSAAIADRKEQAATVKQEPKTADTTHQDVNARIKSVIEENWSDLKQQITVFVNDEGNRATNCLIRKTQMTYFVPKQASFQHHLEASLTAGDRDLHPLVQFTRGLNSKEFHEFILQIGLRGFEQGERFMSRKGKVTDENGVELGSQTDKGPTTAVKTSTAVTSTASGTESVASSTLPVAGVPYQGHQGRLLQPLIRMLVRIMGLA